LGVDNIVFLSIASHQLEPAQRAAARRTGLALALVMRVALLSSVAWIISLSTPVITLWGVGLSWRDLVFGAGGMFLLTKGTREIHGLVEGEDHLKQKAAASLFAVIVQIAIFDLVFSVDSIVTAVGMAEHLSIMIAAVVLAMIVMLVASGYVAEFINRHPTVKMLALSCHPPLEGGSKLSLSDSEKKISGRGAAATLPRPEKFFATLRIFRPALKGYGIHGFFS
jgi:predicted tellurium resistance membrane protein TerC